MLRVNVISDSAYTVQGHGVHTAFTQHVNALIKRQDVAVETNKLSLRFDIVHIHTFGPLGLYQALLAKGEKVISAHVVPESLVGSIVGAEKLLPIIKKFLRWFYNRADMVIAVSPQTALVLQQLGVKKPIEVLQNAIDTSQFTVTAEEKQKLRQELGFKADSFIVLGCGQIQPRKRVDVFQQLATEESGMTFVWAGGMPFKKLGAGSHEMQELRSGNPANFLVTGLLPYEKVRAYFKAADALLFPSEQETFGLVVVEAAAAGLPVVVRDIPDYEESFGSDVIAVNEKKFLDELRRLRDDHEYYQSNQKKSGVLASRYDSSAYADKLQKLYAALKRKA